MLAICNGMPRSASTWSFNVVRTLLEDRGTDVYTAYDENLYRFFTSAPASSRDLVLKCHSLDAMGLSLVRSGAAKLVFTCRDAVDASASFMEMFEPDFERTFVIMKMALDLLAQHRKHGRALLLDYADLVADGPTAVRRVADYMGLAAADDRVAAIADTFGLAQMRRKVEEIGDLDYGPNLVRHDYGLYDPVTLLNVDHIRDGNVGQGRQKFNAAQVRRIEELVRDTGCGL